MEFFGAKSDIRPDCLSITRGGFNFACRRKYSFKATADRKNIGIVEPSSVANACWLLLFAKVAFKPFVGADVGLNVGLFEDVCPGPLKNKLRRL